jgi:hypothetical protein
MIDHREPNIVEYFSCLSRLITNNARYTREIKSRSEMTKVTFDKKILFTGKCGLNLRKINYKNINFFSNDTCRF